MLKQDDVAAALRDESLQGVEAGTVSCGPADGHVVEYLHHRPAVLLICMLTAQTYLVFDRRRVLQVRRIASVDGDAKGPGGVNHLVLSKNGEQSCESWGIPAALSSRYQDTDSGNEI